MTNEKQEITAFELYDDHPLFSRCIGINCPQGWLQLLTELVDWLDDYNVENKCFIGFGQVKIKWNYLTIYAEHYLGEEEFLEQWHLEKMEPVREKIAEICKKSELLCQTCGQAKVESVIDSEIRMVCFDHSYNVDIWRRRK